jgi:hypothetical protein
MKNDVVVITDSNTGKCRVCGLHFVPSSPDDEALHKKTHRELSHGGMPQEVRDFSKAFGWAVAHNNGGLDRLKDHYDPELGKLVVSFVYWSRARSNGAPEIDFDDFMAAHLRFADALTAEDPREVEAASAAIRPWEKFAG